MPKFTINYGFGGIMKKNLMLAISACLTLAVFAADFHNYAPIKGDIKSCTETEFSIASKFGSYFRTPSKKLTRTFDANGKVIASSELTPRDTVLNTITYAYKENGKLAEKLCTNADGESVWKNVYTYNKEGLKADMSEYDGKGNLKDRTIYIYDNGLLVDETDYDGDGVLIWKTVYKYNSAGKIETVYQYNNDGSLSERKDYTYTESGLIDTVSTYETFNGSIVQVLYRYASGSSVLNELTTYNSAKQIIGRVIFKYDEAGNLAKVSEYSVAEKFGTTVNELIGMYEYTYDFNESDVAEIPE